MIDKTETFIRKCNQRRSDMDNYSIIGEYTRSKDKIKIKHLDCGRSFDMKANNFLSNKQKCPHCSPYKFNRKTNSQFLAEVKNLVDDEYVFIEKYKNANTKIKYRHVKCNDINKITPSDFLRGRRCPTCAGNKRLSIDDIQSRIRLIDPDYSLSKENNDNIKNIHDIIYIKHDKCNRIFPKSFNNFRNGQRCTKCSLEQLDSFAVSEIKEYLDMNSIRYEVEKIIEGLKMDRYLRVDFYLPDLDIYIEYDGKQHFEYSENGIFTKENFSVIKERDEFKNNFFKKNDLKLFRINYMENHIKRIEEIISSTTIEREG